MTLRPVITSVEKAYGVDAVEASSAKLKAILTEVKTLLSLALR